MNTSAISPTMEAQHQPTHSRAAKIRFFVWHFVQMVLAMMAGMGFYHLLTGKALVAYPVLNFAGMELSMVPPMVALMRYHRHRWQRSFEMAAAMLVGPAVILTCVQLDLYTIVPGLSRSTLFVLGDVTMYLGMLGVMVYRRAEYTTGHASHRHTSAPETETAKHATHDAHEMHQHAATEHAADC